MYNLISVSYKKFRTLGNNYPLHPSMKDITDSFSDCIKTDLPILKQFMLQHERLEAGDRLLPDLVEFYQWLHVHLAHVITLEKAAILPIHKVIEMAAKHSSKRESLLTLYNRLKSMF